MEVKANKGQAAVYDGIMFLLLAAVSASLIFSFIQTYGEQQDRVLRSASQLNAMQSVFKAIHYIDASSLKGIKGCEVEELSGDCKPLVEGSEAIYVEDVGYKTAIGGFEVMDCGELQKFPHGISVADLLKRDLADGELNNRFGLDPASPASPGRLALKCALKEVMKPFSYAGLKFMAEARNTANDAAVGYDYSEFVVSNSVKARTAVPFPYVTCSDVKDSYVLGGTPVNMLAVSTPFKLITEDSLNPGVPVTMDYVLTICTWSE